MKSIYLHKKYFKSDLKDNEEYIGNGARDKYGDQIWSLYRLQNVLILLIVIEIAFLLFDVLTTNDKYWFQRRGAILVAFSAYLEIFTNSPMIRRAGDHVGSWVFELTELTHKRSFAALVGGSVIWAYGDIVVDLLRLNDAGISPTQ